MRQALNTQTSRQQQGAVLVVGLVMLLIMTMVGVNTISDATIQERMASNNQQISKARINAHSALAAGEQFLAGLNLKTEQDVVAQFSANDDGLFIPLYSVLNKVDAPTADMTNPKNWSANNSVAVTAINSGAQKPRYSVEFIGHLNNSGSPGKASLDAEDKNNQTKLPLVFRITAIGYGDSPNSSAILQSIYTTQQGVL